MSPAPRCSRALPTTGWSKAAPRWTISPVIPPPPGISPSSSHGISSATTRPAIVEPAKTFLDRGRPAAVTGADETPEAWSTPLSKSARPSSSLRRACVQPPAETRRYLIRSIRWASRSGSRPAPMATPIGGRLGVAGRDGRGWTSPCNGAPTAASTPMRSPDLGNGASRETRRRGARGKPPQGLAILFMSPEFQRC